MKKRIKKALPLALRAAALLCAALALAGLLLLTGFELPGSGGQATQAAGLDEWPFQIYFLDAGQGDAILIACEGRYMLIDAGLEKSSGRLVGQLREAGVEHLSLAAATHPHADHIGGMAAALDAFGADTFIMPDCSHTTDTFEAMLDAVERCGADAQLAHAGMSYTLGGAQITVLSPREGDTVEGFEGNFNNMSLVLAVNYDGVRFLLTGDAEEVVETRLVEEGLGRFDLLKAGHHGSSTSSSADFLAAVNPGVTVISCGARNDYGHPHTQVLERLSGSTVYRTDLNGTVRVAVSGGVYYVQPQRDLHP